MKPFTLACVMVRGYNRRYSPKYVRRLKEMVSHYTDRPFNVVCLTDEPEIMPEGVVGIRVPRTRGVERGWWRKMFLFHPNLPFKSRVLYLDLDVLVVKDINPILDFPADFAIAPDSAANFMGKDQWSVVKGYQSSVMVWDHKARSRFFKEYDPCVQKRLWGDQDFIKEISPNEATFPAKWFERVTPNGPEDWTPETKVVLCVKYKPHKAMKLFPWFLDYWDLTGV